MRTRIFSAWILALLAAPLAAGEEETLLDQLAARAEKLTARTRLYVVALADPASRRDFVDSGVTGVLVGSPPRLLIPAHGDAMAQVRFRFGDGFIGDAKLLDFDTEIGVAVYAVPFAAMKEKKALALTKDYLEAGRRCVVVSAGTGGEELDLAKLASIEKEWGAMYVSLRPGAAPPGAVLVDSEGKVAGIHIANPLPAPASRKPLGDRPTGAQSLFLPSPVIARVLEDLDSHGRIRHGYLGIVLGSSRTGGVITSVLPDSPAASAGLEPGDLITGVQGVECRDAAKLSRALALRRPGETIRLKIDRLAYELPVTLADWDPQTEIQRFKQLGVKVVGVGPTLRKYLDLERDQKGVAVTGVAPGSVAAGAGLKRGDVIIEGGGGKISDVDEFNAAIASSRGWIELLVLREGESLPLAVAFRAPSSGKPK